MIRFMILPPFLHTHRLRGVALLLLILLAGCQAAGAQPPIVYLDWDAAGVVQLFRQDDADVTQLTQVAGDVVDFAVAPDARRIAFAVEEAAGSSIWVVGGDGRNPRRLLACPAVACDRLVWAPDGGRLVYERRDHATPGVPRLWWLDAHSGETLSVLQDVNAVSSGAGFAPDGAWLSYVASPDEGIKLYNLEDGRFQTIPSEMGSPAVWSPRGAAFLLRNHQIFVLHGRDDDDHLAHSHDYSLSVYLYRAQPGGDEVRRLSPEAEVDDGAPAWSPDGEWIAFGRKKPRTATGRQLWLMRADGGEARALTDDLLVHHGPPAWSPDGRYLLFQRYPLTMPDAAPSIWLLELASGEMRQVAPRGMQPAWLSPTP